MTTSGWHQVGATLVELIMTIVVLAVGLSGIFNVIGITAQHSADPMVLQQAINISESYLSEITSKPFPTALPCPNTPAAGAREAYNDTCDFNGLNDTGAHNQFAQQIPGLENYNVTVAITQQAVNSVDANNMLQIDVLVNNTAAGITLTFTSFRGNI